jgi:hypothetical protein
MLEELKQISRCDPWQVHGTFKYSINVLFVPRYFSESSALFLGGHEKEGRGDKR